MICGADRDFQHLFPCEILIFESRESATESARAFAPLDDAILIPILISDRDAILISTLILTSILILIFFSHAIWSGIGDRATY